MEISLKLLFYQIRNKRLAAPVLLILFNLPLCVFYNLDQVHINLWIFPVVFSIILILKKISSIYFSNATKALPMLHMLLNGLKFCWLIILYCIYMLLLLEKTLYISFSEVLLILQRLSTGWPKKYSTMINW